MSPRSAPPPVGPLPEAASGGPFDPSYAGLDGLRRALDSGALTAEDLVRFYLDRIRRFDRDGPRINAIIGLNPEALAQARGNDRRRRSGAILGPLDGIPFVAKDNIDTAGVPTTGGSAALLSTIPLANAFVVQRLLDGGAILLAKANMSELAASHGRFGYSSAGGQTVNPFNVAHHVSGSSGGSAAAVAADFAPFALGTDTSGSIRAPASVAGLVGLRPTTGLASRSGVIPMSLTTDTTGPIARSVRDVAIVLDAIAHADPDDAATLGVHRPDIRYAESLDGHSLRGSRIGVVTNFRGSHAEADAVERATLQHLASLGAVLVPLRLPRSYEHLWPSVLEPLGRAEFKPQLDRYLSGRPSPQPRSLRQVIEISLSPAVAGSATPVHPARLRALQDAEASCLDGSPLYRDILARIIPDLRRDLTRTLTQSGLDALGFATMSGPATPHDDDVEVGPWGIDDPYRAGYIASAAGCPEVTVPVGRVSTDLPVGYSFLGRPGSEATLLGLAHALQASLPRSPPPRSVAGP